MKLKYFAVSVMMIFALGVGTTVHSSESEEFVAAFKAANEARKKAATLGHEWRDTAKLLRSAKQAFENGDLDKAKALVANAQLQGEQAIIQAERESKLWEGRVIR